MTVPYIIQWGDKVAAGHCEHLRNGDSTVPDVVRELRLCVGAFSGVFDLRSVGHRALWRYVEERRIRGISI